MPRKVTATIDLDALAHNYQRVKALAPNSKILGMVKADAYGHGALHIAHKLQQSDCDALGVAHLSEAKRLRSKGISIPLVPLSGILNAFELQQHIILKLDILIHQEWQLELLESARISRSMRVWLKIDTGMHRLGIPLEQAEAFHNRLRAINNIDNIVIMTHCATADETDESFYKTQLERFSSLAYLSENNDTDMSFANSAGILSKECKQLMDWVRPGIMLYGSSPFSQAPDKAANQLKLKSVMTLTAQVLSINAVAKGESLGYGRRWIAQRDSIIAIVGIGYGDGYPRHAKDGTPAIINERSAPLAGRVSMDLTSFDITDIAEHVSIGDSVELWGANNSIDIVAAYAETISYELMCRLTERVEFTYPISK